jgi:hypothetical protein
MFEYFPRGLARLGRDEALDEIERDLRDLLPAVVDRERVAAVGDLTISVTPGLRLCRL